jgi:rare lipoprotein A
MKNQLRLFQFMLLIFSMFALSGCSETKLVSHLAKKITWPGQEESQGTYKIGNPYKVESVWYYPTENFNLVETGIASWYGPGFHAAKTANGEVFDQNELTAAHRTLQLPSMVRVTNLQNGRSVVVRVNDRGPFKRGRVMDVSKRAAELLGYAGQGTARVRIEVLAKESRILADAAKQGKNTTRLTLADLQSQEIAMDTAPASVESAPVSDMPQIASLNNDAEMMPESLRTPTITVEELSAPGMPSKTTPPPPSSPILADTGRSDTLRNDEMLPTPLVAGHLNKGKFLPDPVVTHTSVRPTGIYVQAGAFSIRNNAEQLKLKLSHIANTVIEPVTANGRQMYRVKLGPIATVEQADTVLAQVVKSGQGTARVVKGI